MAFNLENMSVDYKKMFKMVPTQRVDLAQSGVIDDFLAALTPGQLVNLFPRYYRDQLPDVGQINQYVAKLDGALSGGSKYQSSSKGDSYTPTFASPPAAYTKTPTAEEMAIQELMKKANVAGIAEPLSTTEFMDPRTSGKLRPEILERYQDQKLPVSIRNNNMGAVSLADESNTFVTGMAGFIGMTPRPADEGGYYAKFATPEHGIAAASKNLENYQTKNINTPSLIVRKWARDGNQNYINTVVSYLNQAGYDVNANTQLDLSDPKIRMAILKGKSAFESGAGIPVYNDEVFEAGVNYNTQSIEAAAKQIKELESILTNFDPNAIGQLDEKLQKWYNDPNRTELQKRQFEASLTKLGADEFNQTMKRQPLTTATLQSIGEIKGLEQKVAIDDDVMLGKKPFIDGNDFAVPIYTNAKGGKKFDENLAGLTPQAIERLKQQAIAAKAAGLTKLELYGAQTHVGHQSHGAGTETDLVGYNADGTTWSRDQRATTALGAVQMGGANRVGLYGGQGLHVGMADEVAGGPSIESAWGPGGKTSGVSIGEFTPGLERDLAAYLKGQGPMPESATLNEHLQKMKEIEEKMVQEDAEARAQASPQSAVLNEQEVAANAQQLQGNTPAPSFATGGEITPGENIAGINTDTGKVEFMANDREKIRIDPAELENTQQIVTPQAATENSATLERPIAPVRERNPQNPTQDLPDPQMFENMVVGYTATPPSQIRAANRAKLYGETSSNLVNGHFA